MGKIRKVGVVMLLLSAPLIAKITITVFNISFVSLLDYWINIYYKWVFFTMLMILVFEIGDLGLSEKLQYFVGSIVGAVLLLPDPLLLFLLSIYALVVSVNETKKPFEQVQGDTKAELVTQEANKLRSWSLTSLALVLALIAFLFPNIEATMESDIFAILLISLLLLLIAFILGEFSLGYNFAMPLQGTVLMLGITLILFAITRRFSPYNILGVFPVDSVFWGILGIWGITLQRNIRFQIVNEEDPRLEEE